MQCWYFLFCFCFSVCFVLVLDLFWFLFLFLFGFCSVFLFRNFPGFSEFPGFSGHFGNIPKFTAGCTRHSAKTREFSLGARARDLSIAVAPPPVVGRTSCKGVRCGKAMDGSLGIWFGTKEIQRKYKGSMKEIGRKYKGNTKEI